MNEQNDQLEYEIKLGEESKSKSAKRLVDEKNSVGNKNPKKERTYRVGNYLIKNTLGSGTFGKVKLGIYLPTKQKVAVKILEKSKMTEKDDLIRLEREFEMLAQFNHPNLIMVTEIFENDNNYYTIMDYCEGGELFNYIVKNKYLSEREASFFYYQIISGLEYIHSLGIVHRDLKPENLLLTKDHILKIIDFGLSNYFKEGQNELLYTPCGSPCYASPEMVTGNNYDGVMIDIWSTGIILFAMLCGYLPFEDKNNEKLFQKIAECKIEYPSYLSETSIDLLKKIIVPDPKKRITINEIKKHPFYLKGKKLFDHEFTIQYLSDDNNNEKNENVDNNIKKDDNNQDKKNNDIKDIKENNCIEKKDDIEIKENKKDKILIENNYLNFDNLNDNINYNNINQNLTDKNKIDKNNIIKELNKESYNSTINGSNNNYSNNKISKQKSDTHNSNKINNKHILDIINEKININNKDTNFLTTNMKNTNNKHFVFNLNNNLDKTQKEKELNENNNKKVKNINKEIIDLFSERNNNKANNDNEFNINLIHNMHDLVNSLNNNNFKENNKTIEVSKNIPNTENNDNTNKNMKNIKKPNDKNNLLIESLNNSVDNKKIINNNDNNATKENNKKTNDCNNAYSSNTYNMNNTKNKLKANKLINTVLGKILKEKSKENHKKEKVKNEKEKIQILDTKKKKEEDFNQKILSTRNTYCELESKILEKPKINSKSKERKTNINRKNNKYFNPQLNTFLLDTYNYHQLAMSSDIKNNHSHFAQIDINNKNSIIKINDNIHIIENNKGNKSVRQDCYPTAMKKLGAAKKIFTQNLKFNSSSINKNASYNNKGNNDFQDYTIKTETNEVLLTDNGNNNLDKNSKPKFKKKNNLNKIESKLSTKDTNKPIKKSLYKKQNTGIYSSNNLNNFKINNGIFFKNITQSILNENRLTSNRKRNFKTKFKFNNLSHINNKNINNSENKTKKYNKIFIQKKDDNTQNLTNIAGSYSSKINNNNFNSNFVNYNNNININNGKERKNTSSKNKSFKNDIISNVSNKNPVYYIEDGVSSIDYEKNNNITNKNANQTIKSNNLPGKTVRQIKKNNNYIHIKKNKIKSGNNQRNKSKSITKNKAKQKSISTEEPFNLKEYNNENDIMKNPFNQINKALILNNKRSINKNKINLKKNYIYEVNNTNSNKTTNPLVNIRNTFISFNMYPKYYLESKKQLSSPKIYTTSPKKVKQTKKNNSNMKVITNKKITSTTNKNHLRQNTSPSLESPSKQFEIKNFMNVQQNIFNNVENQKLYYYTNTEYEQNILPKNMNLETIQNTKNKLQNKNYKAISKNISYNNKITNFSNNTVNQLLNPNTNNNKNLSNTISPTNDKKYSHKIYLKSTNNKNHLKFNKINTTNNLNNVNKNYRNYLTNYVLNSESDLKKSEIENLEQMNKLNFKKKYN